MQGGLSHGIDTTLKGLLMQARLRRSPRVAHPTQGKKNTCQEHLPEPQRFFVLSEDVLTYFFLCAAQNFDFPLAEFLHFFPSLVFAAHFGVFAVAIVPSLFFFDCTI